MAEKPHPNVLFPDAGGLFILGVTGGIASGKSTVARMLVELGAPMIDFDILAREVVGPGRSAFREIVDCFGEEVVGKDGTLDRKRLSNRVFQDPAKRRILEGITHPRILQAYDGQLKALARQNPQGILQAVIPLLFEVHLEVLVHKVLVVAVSRDTQVKRLMRRDQISRQAADRILDAQMPIDEKVARADYVIRNEAGLDQTRKAVRALWKTLNKVRNKRA